MGAQESSAELVRQSCARSAFDSALAVSSQVERLREFATTDPYVHSRRSADAQFLIVALWRLRMAALMCSDLVPEDKQVPAAIATFDDAFPGLASLRHVLMHYDNYLLENDQRRNKLVDKSRLVGRKDVEALSNNVDGVAWLGQWYQFDMVLPGSADLYRAVAEALGTSGM